MGKTRTERDSMGELEVPADALYGAQTQRAVNNFPVSGQRMPEPFIRALVLIKLAAARVNGSLQCIEPPVADAIIDACEVLLKQPDLLTHFLGGCVPDRFRYQFQYECQ